MIALTKLYNLVSLKGPVLPPLPGAALRVSHARGDRDRQPAGARAHRAFRGGGHRVRGDASKRCGAAGAALRVLVLHQSDQRERGER